MPDTILLIQMLIVLCGIGAFAGVLAGLLGVGGGIVLVPVFFYAFQTLGYDAPPRRHDGHDLVEVHAKNTLTTQDMMADLAAGHERLCDLLSDLTRLANDQFDIATGDIALDRIAFHKQAAWMLREIATA